MLKADPTSARPAGILDWKKIVDPPQEYNGDNKSQETDKEEETLLPPLRPNFEIRIP